MPLADHVRRINNGKVVAEGADELRAVIRRGPKVATHGFRWLVDGDHAVTFYDLDADMGGDAPIFAYIGERFTVRPLGTAAEIALHDGTGMIDVDGHVESFPESAVSTGLAGSTRNPHRPPAIGRPHAGP